MERRRYARLEIQAACLLQQAGDPTKIRAVIRNISRNGLLIALPADEVVAPADGDFWTVDVDLPPSEGFARRCLHCAGKVTRVVEQPGDSRLVALSIWLMAFRDRCAPAAFVQGACDSEVSWPLV